MQHHAAALGQTQVVRREILNRIDHGFINDALRRIDLRLADAHMNEFSGNAHIQLADLGSGLKLCRRDRIPHALYHLSGRIPISC